MHHTCTEFDCAMPATGNVETSEPDPSDTGPLCAGHLIMAIDRHLRAFPFFTVRSVVA